MGLWVEMGSSPAVSGARSNNWSPITAGAGQEKGAQILGLGLNMQQAQRIGLQSTTSKRCRIGDDFRRGVAQLGAAQRLGFQKKTYFASIFFFFSLYSH
ncbi:hypothetical protein ACFX2J_037554 [Malus domestica]